MSAKLKKYLLKFAKAIAYSCFLGISVLCLLEIAYRYQWIDFYKTEITALNKDVNLTSCNKRILVFGDSFSAQSISFVNKLRDSMPEACIINAAVPGTGIMQTAMFAEDRIRTFKPDIIIYQLYIGNDLTDIRHPLNWEKISFSRNAYWWLSDRFRILSYLNYKAGQFKSPMDEAQADPKTTSVFSPDSYSIRTKTYLQADDSWLQKSILLKNDYRILFDQLEDELRLIHQIQPEVPMIILPIPHCTQTSDYYVEQYLKMGMSPDHPEAFSAPSVFSAALSEGLMHEPGIRILDPLHFMRGLEQVPVRLYYENDPHLNETGNQYLSTWLYPELMK